MDFLHTDKVIKVLIFFLFLIICMSFSLAGTYQVCVTDCFIDKITCEIVCYNTYCGGGCGAEYTNCTNGCNAIYNICFTACEIIDEDGDGINDYNDSTIGTEDDVLTEGIVDLEVYVGSYQSNESNASTVTGTETVRFFADSEPVLEFDQDFSSTNLNLVDIEIKKQESDTTHGIVIKGINESTVPDKTIYLDKRLSDGSLCIKDAEIDDIEDITTDCQGEDELFFGRCEEGESIGSVGCSIVNGRYKIQGLSHSGAVEMNISGIFSGFFTVEYLNTLNSHKDGYLMPGEGIEICFESARPILDDEHLRFVFIPLYGGLSVNEMYTPQIINLFNIHIYP